LLPFLSLHAVLAEEDIAVESVAQAVPTTQPKTVLEGLWSTATQLELDGQFEAAVNTYTAILKAEPSSRRAAYQLAYGLEKTGKRVEAAAAYDAVIAKAPFDFWAGSALWSKAQLARSAGKTDDVRKCIQNIKAFFPESPQAAKAMLLEAQVDQRDTKAAEALIARDNEARRVLGQAGAADKDKDEKLAVQLYDYIIKTYPDTPAALRAYDAKGHILVRDRQKEKVAQAVPAFQAIIDKAGVASPHSRIVENARMRLGAIHHSNGQRLEAMKAYWPNVDSPNPSIAAEAGTKYAGLAFEFVQRDIWAKNKIDDQTWDNMKVVCDKVSQLEGAPIERKARAELMKIEMLCWRKQNAEAVKAADEYLAKYKGESLQQDIATVRFFAGEAAEEIRDYAKALQHFRWIVEAYKDQNEIWPGMDHLPRTYFRIWETLLRSKAPEADIQKAADELLSRFQDSSYTRSMLRTTKQLKPSPEQPSPIIIVEEGN